MGDGVKSGDLLGIAAYGEALKVGVEKSAEVVGELLLKVCAPAAEEVGFYLQDHVKLWRLKNLEKLAITYKKLGISEEGKSIAPKVFVPILDAAGWNDDQVLTKMWAGLIASSTSEDGKDDSNLIFIDVLKGLTSVQAKIFQYVCSTCEVEFPNGIIFSKNSKLVSAQELITITGCSDIERLDREIDHLDSLNLVDGTFYPDVDPLTARLSPTAMGLQLFARTQGSTNLQSFYASQLKKK